MKKNISFDQFKNTCGLRTFGLNKDGDLLDICMFYGASQKQLCCPEKCIHRGKFGEGIINGREDLANR